MQSNNMDPLQDKHRKVNSIGNPEEMDREGESGIINY